MRYQVEGENYMKKRGRVLILLITAALAIEPLQLVYAEPAVDNLTGNIIFRKVVFVIPDGRPLSRRNAIIYLTVSLPRNDG